MTTTPTPAEGAPSAWRRMASRLERWAEAMDFDMFEHHERRIAQLEHELEVLRGDRTNSRGRASVDQEIDKEVQ